MNQQDYEYEKTLTDFRNFDLDNSVESNQYCLLFKLIYFLFTIDYERQNKNKNLDYVFFVLSWK